MLMLMFLDFTVLIVDLVGTFALSVCVVVNIACFARVCYICSIS